MFSGNKAIIVLIFVTCFVQPVISQQQNNNFFPETGIEAVIRYITESFDEESDLTAIYDDLAHLREHPININLAKEEDLLMLHALNSYQINSLIEYIKVNGSLGSIYELQFVYGFSEELVKLIAPFVTIKQDQENEIKKLKKMSLGGYNTLITRQNKIMEKQKGYLPDSSSSYYLGAPFKLYSRYQYNFENRVLWGVTMEKDAGEEFFKGSNKNGFDFYSAHIQINSTGVVKTLILGDYNLQFGQGVVMWQGMSMGKNADIEFTKKDPQCVRRYISTDENNFFRGVAVTMGGKNLNLSLFYSNKRIDANVLSTDSLGNEIGRISSFMVTGSHAVPYEIRNEDAVREITYGGNLMYRSGKFRAGATFLNYSYNIPFAPEYSPAGCFNFNGDQNMDVSFDYQYNAKQVSVFGEAAISRNMKAAWFNGVILHAGQRIIFSAIYRNYSPAYHAFYASSFAENSNPINENGFYLGTKFLPFRHWDISAFWDSFNFPWMSYNVKAPSSGSHYLVHVNYAPASNVSMYLRITQKSKPFELSMETDKMPLLTKYTKTNFRFHIAYSSLKNWYFKNRVEVSKYIVEKNINETGYLLYQDIEFKPEQSPLAISARLALFSTESYNTRVYAYEDDALYNFSMPSYFDQGTRVYFNVKYAVTKWAKFWIKISQIYYENKSTNGSGLNEIEGNKKTEVTIQARFKF